MGVAMAAMLTVTCTLEAALLVLTAFVVGAGSALVGLAACCDVAVAAAMGFRLIAVL